MRQLVLNVQTEERSTPCGLTTEVSRLNSRLAVTHEQHARQEADNQDLHHAVNELSSQISVHQFEQVHLQMNVTQVSHAQQHTGERLRQIEADKARLQKRINASHSERNQLELSLFQLKVHANKLSVELVEAKASQALSDVSLQKLRQQNQDARNQKKDIDSNLTQLSSLLVAYEQAQELKNEEVQTICNTLLETEHRLEQSEAARAKAVAIQRALREQLREMTTKHTELMESN